MFSTREPQGSRKGAVRSLILVFISPCSTIIWSTHLPLFVSLTSNLEVSWHVWFLETATCPLVPSLWLAMLRLVENTMPQLRWFCRMIPLDTLIQARLLVAHTNCVTLTSLESFTYGKCHQMPQNIPKPRTSKNILQTLKHIHHLLLYPTLPVCIPMKSPWTSGFCVACNAWRATRGVQRCLRNHEALARSQGQVGPVRTSLPSYPKSMWHSKGSSRSVPKKNKEKHDKRYKRFRESYSHLIWKDVTIRRGAKG